MVTSSSIYLFLSSSSLLFSLRTSEANYLHESFGFYSAIRSRAYYSQASKEQKYVYSIVSFGVVFKKERHILRSKMAIDQSFSSPRSCIDELNEMKRSIRNWAGNWGEFQIVTNR